MTDISLIISAQAIESIEGRLDPAMDSRVGAYRLVHEQQCAGSEVRWYFFAKADLSKPEAMARAQHWFESTRHPDWPGLVR